MTSRSVATPGSLRAIAATAASHWARRSLYAERSSRRVEPVSVTTIATSSSGSGTARNASDRQSSSSAAPSSPIAEANWSISPQATPTYSFSPRWAIRASDIRSVPGSSPPASASADASSSAAELESPAPCGRSDARTPRNPRTGRSAAAIAHAVAAT